MEKKYTITEETYVIGERVLHRIRAEKSFNNVKKGDLGGFIEKEKNLSQDGDCWVYDKACVYEDAKVSGSAIVFDNAYIHGNAHIYGNAHICGNAYIHGNTYISDDVQVYGNAKIYGNAHIYDNVRIRDNVYVYDNAYISGDANIYENACVFGDASVLGNVCIYGCACIYGNARIYDYVCIYDSALVYGDAYICDNARVFEKARVCGNAHVCGNARVCEQAIVQYSRLKTDIRKDLRASLRCQCNLIPENDKVIAYKLVFHNLRSIHDINFIYEIGKTAICENPAENNSSCAAGLHFSNLTYWDNRCYGYLDELVYLKAEIDLKDIITIQEGKIRCRKARILSKIEIEQNG